jgi:hypothetical protein
MRYLAIARFRLLTMARTATPIFLGVIAPVLFFTIVMAAESEPQFRLEADEQLPANAGAAIAAWVLHGAAISFACLMSGKVKSPHDDVRTGLLHDLMDTAPVGASARFWGEALGSLLGTLTIHTCCLPVLAVIAAMSPLPIRVFLWIEASAIAFMILAAGGAAWQRRAPRTKMAATRGPRNVIVFVILFLVALLLSIRREAFRDAFAMFLFPRMSMRGWAEVWAAVEHPIALAAMFAVLYFGTLAFYYVSSTRKRTQEN